MTTLIENYCSICNKELITRGGGQLIMSPGCCDQFYHQTCMNTSLVSLNGFICNRCNNINENECSKVKFQIFNLFRCKMSWPVCFPSKRYNTKIPLSGTDYTDYRMVQPHINNNNTSQLCNLLANEDCMICLQSLQLNSNNTTATHKSYCLPILCRGSHLSSPQTAVMSPACCGKFYHQHCIRQMVKAKARRTNLSSSSAVSSISHSLLCPNCRHVFSLSPALPLLSVTSNSNNRSNWWLLVGAGSENRRRQSHQSSVTAVNTTAAAMINNNNPLSHVLSAILNQFGAFLQQQAAELNTKIRCAVYFIVELSLLVFLVLLFSLAVLHQKKSQLPQY